MRRISALFVSYCAIMMISMGGCQSYDLSNYVTSTAQVASSVAAAGSMVDMEVRVHLEQPELADELKVNWEKRNLTMKAMMRYSQALSEIADAGNSGSSSAGKVADAVSGLAEAAGYALPGGTIAVAVVEDGVKLLYQLVGNIRAAKSLESALAEAQPAVEQLVSLLKQDFKDLDEFSGAVSGLQIFKISMDDEIQDVLDLRKKLYIRLGDLDSTDMSEHDEYMKVYSLFESVNARYTVVYSEKIRDIEARLNTIRTAILLANQAVDDWALVHANLTESVRAKRPVDTQILINTVTEMHKLLERMREL